MRNKEGMTIDADGRTERMITVAELVLMKERRDALRDALEAAFASWFDKPSNIEKIEPEWVSQARAALDAVREMEEPCS